MEKCIHLPQILPRVLVAFATTHLHRTSKLHSKHMGKMKQGALYSSSLQFHLLNGMSLYGHTNKALNTQYSFKKNL